MGMKRFITTLLVLSIFFLFYDIKSIKSDIKKDEKPLVSFYDAISYTIDEHSVTSIVRANEIYLYKKREEMVSATMLLRQEQQTETNFAKADFVTKIEDDLYLDGNVMLQAQRGVQLTSEQLEYNTKTKIAKNQLPFVIEYNESVFRGEKLYLDFDKRFINGNNVKFSLKDLHD